MLRTQGDIVREAVKRCELPQYEVKQVLKAIQDAIFEYMVNGDNVMFSPLGRFEITVMPSRKARNPRTGETFEMGPQRKASFRPFIPLKDAVKANKRGLDGEEKV